MIPIRRRALAVTLLPLATAGCGLFGGSLSLRTIAFRVAENANGNAPVALDLVLISDQAAVAPVMALNASEWFQQREQFLRDYPGKIKVMNFELVPGSTVAERPVDRSPRPVAAIIFANYQSQGAHRLRVGSERDLVVVLGERGVSFAQ